MARMPRFDYTWTIGNIITLIALLFSVVGIFIKLNVQIAQQSEIIRQITEQIRQLEQVDLVQASQIRSLELTQGRIDEKLLNIVATLQEIKATLQQRNSP